MTKTNINIKKIAKLAELTLTDEEAKVLEEQLEKTIEHIESLDAIDTDNVALTNEVTDLKNVAREDVVVPSLSQTDALKNAKKTYNGFFMVPVILEEAVA